MSLRVFSSPSGYTQAAQFSRNKQAESQSAQPQFASGTDSYSFSRKATEAKPHFGSESTSDRFFRNLEEVSQQGLLKYGRNKAREKGDLRADLADAERQLNKLEGTTFFKPEVRVLTEGTGRNRRPIPTRNEDPSGQHAYVYFHCLQVQDGRVHGNPDGDFIIKRRTLIQPPNDSIEGINPRYNSRQFKFPTGSRFTHNPIYYWNEERQYSQPVTPSAQD